MVEFLVKNLSDQVVLATLSRGYGRKTKGFLSAKPTSSPKEIGDEPLQVFRKFKGKVPVFVGEDRVKALTKIKESYPAIDLVVMDDAFQHRRLNPDYKILLTCFLHPFFKDFLMPSGKLRESRFGALRADLIVVTKCPSELDETQRINFKRRISDFTRKGTPVYFSSIGYGKPYSVVGGVEEINRSEFFLVSGLADDRMFEEYCRKSFSVVGSMSFPDHRDYNSHDAKRILEEVEKIKSENLGILTTEKDSEKLKSLAEQGLLKEIPIFALPMEAIFAPGEQEKMLRTIREKFNIK